MEINKKNARQWSRFGSRATLGQSLYSLAEVKKDLMVLSADLGGSSGLKRYIQTYPEKYLNIGISEQNMIGVASGLAREGFVVFATSFAPFIAMRASEQVRMNMGYMDANVKAVALGSGVAMSFLGNSHYGIEDAAIMRSIPNLTVVSPADCTEIVKTIFAAADYDGPMYIRLTGETNNPSVYLEDYNFQIGKAVTLMEGKDITIIANGTMVYESIQAAKHLKEEGVLSTVVNMHTIKPLDTSIIDKAIGSSKLIVTIEEHSIVGGLGGAVAEYKSGFKASPPQLILGLPDEFGKVGSHRYLLKKYDLTGIQIAKTILKKYK